MSLATFLLRVRSLAMADSARRVLERAQTIDSTSLDVAERLGEAYVTVLERGGLTPPVSRDAAVRRIDALGAPVFPGNLLLIAHRGGSMILGAPGCVRSRAANVVDLVLPRLLLGDRLVQRDIA